MNVVKPGSDASQEQPKQVSQEELNNQLNMEFAIIRVRTAALELMKLKMETLLTISSKTSDEEITKALNELKDKITNFPV